MRRWLSFLLSRERRGTKEYQEQYERENKKGLCLLCRVVFAWKKEAVGSVGSQGLEEKRVCACAFAQVCFSALEPSRSMATSNAIGHHVCNALFFIIYCVQDGDEKALRLAPSSLSPF